LLLTFRSDLIEDGLHVIGDIQDDADAQAFEDLEEFPPVNRAAAPFHLAEEILTDADTPGGIVLAQALGFAGGADDGADIDVGSDGDVHFVILMVVRIIGVSVLVGQDILIDVRISVNISRLFRISSRL
jgi:hypothetical protein